MAAFHHLHKATAIVPLAVLSLAWTASLTGVGASTATAGDKGSGILPDGSSVPAEAIEAPASVGEPIARTVSVSDGTATGIPGPALAAYQRAGAVINEADRSCRVPWELIAAIGRVESDHGRHGGNSLDDNGVARPGIYGIALDGTRNTQKITDTDGGQYDNDTEYDRAVGPMQFIPSTWAVVGVDGDSDGQRNPQDVDDAALATAVYLCSGDDDLSQEKGQRASVYRYNHSNDYVDLVLEIMQAYMDGDFGAANAAAATSWVPPRTGSTAPYKNAGGKKGGKKGGKQGGKPGKPTKPAPAPAAPAPTAPAPVPPPPPPPSAPAPAPNPTSPPTKLPTTLPSPLPSAPLPPPPSDPVGNTLTYAEAQAQCLATGLTLLQVAELEACIKNLMGG